MNQEDSAKFSSIKTYVEKCQFANKIIPTINFLPYRLFLRITFPKNKFRQDTSLKSQLMEDNTNESENNLENQVKNLHDLFESGLNKILWAEQELIKALPKMLEQATAQKLKTAINEHIDQTMDQVLRLETIFESLGKEAKGEKCLALEGLLKEGEILVEQTEPGFTRDACIIASSQKIEHYEIAGYGTLAAFAKILNERLALDLLLKTMGEEK